LSVGLDEDTVPKIRDLDLKFYFIISLRAF
jgi:hypothetical protein